MQQIAEYFPRDIAGEIQSFLSQVPEYYPLGCCTALCSCCGENCPGDNMSNHGISPVGLRMQGIEYGIRACSKPLCLQNYEIARRCNYMTREQLIARIGKENFEFHFNEGESSQLGPVGQADTWQFGVCVRENDDHRVTLYTMSDNQMSYQRISFYLSDLLAWNLSA